MQKKGKGREEKLLRDLCQSGVDKACFSGCMAGVSVGSGDDCQRFIAGAGKCSYEANAPIVKRNTIFDLASLTKPLCTTLCILILVQKGELKWETPLADCLKEFKNDPYKRNIRIEHLLTHSSGLKAYRPYFRFFKSVFEEENKARLLNYIHYEKKAYAPGTQNIYSDLGYILLGEIIERKTGQTLDYFFAEQVTRKLNLENDLFFIPLNKQRGVRSAQDFAATEKCPWRSRVIHGEVHDENCWVMGGIAGHAGLFGTIDGVLRICGLILDRWVGKGDTLSLSKELFNQLFTTPNTRLNWYRGFDRPTPGGSSSGRYFSEKSAGHLGFSGTSFWIDPEKKIIVVLLTNRVHPSRENIQIRSFRPWFHDKIMESILK